MSSQDEDGRSLDKGSESHSDILARPKISYSREFLLSIGNSDLCKKLPRGFEESLTSELEDALLRIPDRPRIPGGLPLQGFRRNEHASSPPTRGESGSYSRGGYGKWESRSSVRSDRDSDSQSDRDPDSARRYGNNSRRSWQTPEHDGLLGSGSFPKSSGYAAGISSKVRVNEPNQLSRSIEPYHPPRPYKALPHSRKDTDAFNDETFGSVEYTSEDRAEQERRRRASFEMMRKEQHKALQEKQKVGGISNLNEVLVDSKEEKGLLGGNNEVEVSAVTPLLSNDIDKSSLASHTSASRPLIPPGFKNNPLDKSSGFKSLVHPSPSEVGKPATGGSSMDADTNLIPNSNDDLESKLSQISLLDGQPAEKTQHGLLFNKGENVNVHISLDVPVKKPAIEDQLFGIPSQLDSHGTLGDPGITELNAEVLEDKAIHSSRRSPSTSILKKIFGSALPVNDGHSSSAELRHTKPDDTWSPDSAHSSKLARWFSVEESKAVDGVSSSRENDLLSLIVSGDKEKQQLPDSEAAKLLAHNSPYKTSKNCTPVKLGMPSAADRLSGQAGTNNKEEAAATVLTCEDLEQTILSEFSANTTDVQPHLKSWSATGGDTAQPKARVDNNASLHLLSMLQKSGEQSNTTVNSVKVNLAGKQLVSQELGRPGAVNEPPKVEENGKIAPNLGKTLTLEALFGTAFMQELQSVEAPVSVQRGSEPHGLPFPVPENDISSSAIGRSGLPRPSHDHSMSSNHRQHTKLPEAENWRVDDSHIGIPSPKRLADTLNHHGGLERGAEFQLPEEDNLISVGDTQDQRLLTFMSPGNSMNPSSSPPINIMEKLAAFGAVVKDKHSMEGSESMPPFARGSYQQMQPDISFHNLQLHQQSSPHFQPPQMSQGRPLYHLESDPARMSPQLKFLGPEPILNHDSPANHPFSSNIIRPSFHQPNVRVSGFDVPSQHPMLHHMQMPGNHPPHFARGGPVPHHGNQTTAFRPEMNQMQGFPLGPRQPSIGGGVPMPGNTPEAFQRLIEMELRANSKQIHPRFSPPVHGQGGIFGHEVDMAYRYR